MFLDLRLWFLGLGFWFSCTKTYSKLYKYIPTDNVYSIYYSSLSFPDVNQVVFVLKHLL